MSTIIELKEESIENSQSNNYIPERTGDYTCQVGEITLFKGDQLAIRSAFIDQVAENTDLIEVLADGINGTNSATLSLKFGYYVQDWGSTPTDAVGATPEGNSISRNIFLPEDLRPAQGPIDGITYPQGQPNGQLYIGCNVAFHNTPAAKANLAMLTGISIGIANVKNSKDSSQKNIRVGYFRYQTVLSTDAKPIYKNVTIVFQKSGFLDRYHAPPNQYVDINDTNVSTYIRFGKNDHVTGGPTTTPGFKFPLAMRRGTFEVNYSTYNNKETRKNGTFDHYMRMFEDDHLLLGGVVQSDMEAGGTYDVTEVTQQVTIPAKSYQPEDLAQQISAAFASVDPDPLPNHEVKNNFISTNRLITTTDNYNTNFVDNPFIRNAVPGYPGDAADGMLSPAQQEQIFGNWVADDGFQIMQRQSVTNNFRNQVIGTNSFDVHFDGSRFSIQSMHTPIYDNNGNNIVKSIQCVQTKDGVQKTTRRFANKSSGIFLTDLQPTYLWFKIMKFSDSIKVGAHTGGSTTLSVPTIPASATNVNCVVPRVNLVDGVNITGDIVSLGSVMSAPSNNVGILWDETLPFNNKKMIESQTIPILADLFNSNDTKAEKNGYYQLEIDCGINSTDIRGQDSPNNKIKAIISKYYTDKSYLSSYSEGAIPYIHTSDIPLTLSQFKVRILDSKGRLASINNQIGPDNTVFMEITRGDIEK